MAEWSVRDVALPPISAKPNNVKLSPQRRKLQVSTSSRLRQSPQHDLARSPRQLSPRVRKALQGVRQRQQQSPTYAAATAAPSAALSFRAVEHARLGAPKRNVAIARYVDEVSPVPGSSLGRSKNWSIPQAKPQAKHKKRKDKKKKTAASKSSQPFVGVAKKEYWKVWNRFSQDKSDPRIMVPAGIQQADIARVFYSLATRGVIHRTDFNSLLNGIGVSDLQPHQLDKLFSQSRTVGVDPSKKLAHTQSSTFSLQQVFACFVQICQLELGARLTVEPLVPGLKLASSEASGSPTHTQVRGSPTGDSLPPIRRMPDRGPLRTAPANMRRSVQRGLDGLGGSAAASLPRHRSTGTARPSSTRKVVVKSAASSRKPSSSLFRKFQQLERRDEQAGRRERSSKAWTMAKGSFVRTGDRFGRNIVNRALVVPLTDATTV